MSNRTPDERYYTTGQLAKLAGLSVQKIRDVIDAGTIPGVGSAGTARRVERMAARVWLAGLGVTDPDPDSKPYTTQQLADLAGVSIHTVIRAVDGGEIPGSFRVPDSKFRRIPRQAAVAWMAGVGLTVAGVPMPASPGRVTAGPVLLLGVPATVSLALTAAGVGYVTADSPFEAGIQFGRWSPRSLVVDASVGERTAAAVLVRARALAGRLSAAALLHDVGDKPAGFDVAFRHPFDSALLVAWLKGAGV